MQPIILHINRKEIPTPEVCMLARNIFLLHTRDIMEKTGKSQGELIHEDFSSPTFARGFAYGIELLTMLKGIPALLADPDALKVLNVLEILYKNTNVAELILKYSDSVGGKS